MNPESWQRLTELLSSSQPPCGFVRRFPDDSSRLSFLEALKSNAFSATDEHLAAGAELEESLQGLTKQLTVFREISRCPILAITGLLNSGKSSLLATYLSPQNRPRVLRGLGNDSGTHRFVLWLPKVWWDDPELLSTLVSFLTGLFGHPPENLSEDPNEAAMQYNGSILARSLLTAPEKIEDSLGVASESGTGPNPMSIPLIAYDESLDELKLGLIDCPDIQTGFLGTPSGFAGEELARERRRQLACIGRLCSAFVVVCKLNSLHDEGLLSILSTLRDSMPGVPRLLAVNKVKARYSPETVHDQSRGVVDRFGIGDVYAAYDFRSALAESRVPKLPKGMVHDAEQGQPIFFRTHQAIDANTRARIAHEHGAESSGELQYLYDLGNRLDVGTLSKESSRSLELQLRAKVTEALSWLKQNDELRETKISDCWQAIADACYEFMAERDTSGRATGLRLQASPAIVAQMADSLQRTAPLWMGVSLKIDRSARQLQQAVANSASRFKILQNASNSVTRFTKRFKRGEGARVVTPDRLAEAIRSADIHDAMIRVSQEKLVADCNVAMLRFADEDKTRLNEEELDKWSRQVWKGMSLKDKIWKGTQPLAVLMAPLLAAVLVPIDGGGTAVLVFASTKELLAAAGIAAVMTPMATGGETLGIVQRETPWRQLSDLFAIACDSVGLPRPSASELPSSRYEGVPRQLLPSNLEIKPPAGEGIVNKWTRSDELIQGIQSTLQQLS